MLQIITIAMCKPMAVLPSSSTMTAGLMSFASSFWADSPLRQAAMKFLPSFATLALTLLSVSTPSNAQQEAQRGREVAKGQNSGEVQRSFLRRTERPRTERNAETSPLREAPTIQPAEELRPVQEPGIAAVQGRERLSPEERRQLRRDINAAGRDIYRRHRPD